MKQYRGNGISCDNNEISVNRFISGHKWFVHFLYRNWTILQLFYINLRLKIAICPFCEVIRTNE